MRKVIRITEYVFTPGQDGTTEEHRFFNLEGEAVSAPDDSEIQHFVTLAEQEEVFEVSILTLRSEP